MPKIKPVNSESKQCNMCDCNSNKTSLHVITVHKESVHLGEGHICPQTWRTL